MPLITETQRQDLLANATRQRADEDLDLRPVVKLFTPDAAATWLLAELNLEDPDIAYGLCDLGLGEPELGTVRLSEIEALRGPGGLAVEQDIHFRPDRTLGEYAAAARREGRINA